MTRSFCLDRAADCDERAAVALSEESRLEWEADAADWRTAAEAAEPAPMQ